MESVLTDMRLSKRWLLHSSSLRLASIVFSTSTYFSKSITDYSDILLSYNVMCRVQSRCSCVKGDPGPACILICYCLLRWIVDSYRLFFELLICWPIMRRYMPGHRSGVNRLYRLNHSRKVVGLRGAERRGRNKLRTRDRYRGWGKVTLQY